MSSFDVDTSSEIFEISQILGVFILKVQKQNAIKIFKFMVTSDE